MPIIEIPSALQKYAGNQEEVTVSGATVGEAFAALIQQYGEIQQHLYDDKGKIRSFINVYLNDEDIRYAQNLETPVGEKDSIQIVPSIAGGR